MRSGLQDFRSLLQQLQIHVLLLRLSQLATFSYFDVGSEGAGNQEPERFYHGFVLGLIADQTDIYEIRSNRESGFGRYDVMMVPKEREKTKIPAIILEFKVKNNKKEQTLEENSTVSTSADQRKKL